RNKSLILFYGGLKTYPVEFIKEVYPFLGVDLEFSPESFTHRGNVKKPLPKNKIIYEAMQFLY
ncbi:MAG: hypothetical protein AAGG53_10840, partial [Cyanobacteria bacterium P01_H01_bin.152]